MIYVEANRFKQIAYAFLFCGVVIVSYAWIISPEYAYMGYVNNPPSPGVFTSVFVAAAIPSFFLPTRIQAPSSVVLWILYLVAFVPSCLIPMMTGILDLRLLLQIVSILLACQIILVFVTSRGTPSLGLPHLSLGAAIALLLTLTCFSYAAIVATFGLSLALPSLADVYDVRSEYRENLTETSNLIQYVIHWQANVVNPVLLAIGMSYRKWNLAAIAVIGQLLVFSVTGFKSVFFSSLLVAGLLLLLSPTVRGQAKSLVKWATIGLTAITILDLITGKNLLSSLFVRRLIDTPGLLTGFYIDFFHVEEKMFLKYSVLSFLGENPYGITPPFLIGEEYFDRTDFSANANIWADGYANFGVVGMIGVTILLGAILVLGDALAHGKDARICCVLLGVPALSLSNAALLTSMLTHGVALAYLIIAILPNRSNTLAHEQHDVSSRAKLGSSVMASAMSTYRSP